jgi:hypothetical protein
MGLQPPRRGSHGLWQLYRDEADRADVDQGIGGHAGLVNDSAGDASPIAADAIADEAPQGVSDGHRCIPAAMSGNLQ